ncbi:hypothetical protein [Pseudomonas syringae group genomosp. 3]|uniref:hypothetical protein n=1 Tax=Pseudomonas syringae group genomosp. 3 TaxID=251701 RepID=UPI0011C38A4A|nr:hypothetical protein [Pseudomonas syringae group genomosp. 3]
MANWQLSLPDDLQFIEENGNPHFKRSDGRIEIFLKSVKLVSISDSEATAAYIQKNHENSFLDLPDYKWRMSTQTFALGNEFRSILKLYDQEKNYVVFSIVASLLNEAIQVTVHDYFSKSSDEARNICKNIEASIKRV